MLTQLVYSSEAHKQMSAAELESILVRARTRNVERDVTGILVHAEGVFLQVLEGEREVVTALAERIAADPRHHDMKVFHQSDIPERTFPSWRMAFVSPSAAELATWVGLEGTTTVEAVLEALNREPERVPRAVLSFLDALASH
jgi:hypothetical protein